VKDTIKRLIGRASSSRWLRSACIRQFGERTNVAYYHCIGPSTPYYASFYSGCTVERFREDLERLSEVFRFESLEANCASRGSMDANQDRPSISITFDDGFRINRPEVLALFEEFQIKATTFLNTRFVGNQDLMWRNKLSTICSQVAEDVAVAAYNRVAQRFGMIGVTRCDEILLKSRDWEMTEKDGLADEIWEAAELAPLSEFLEEHQPYFTWSELEEWRAAGHGIGLHTHTHPFCSRLDEEGIRSEIVEPARSLKARFGLDLLALSYPFGDRLDPEREQALVDEGVVDYIFGIAGSASRLAPNSRLERAGLEEHGVGWPVFGDAMMSAGRKLIRRSR
jgi:peptidoglycan/xylan/chitin deacetylase (PgdA/CDA1 family)